HPIDCFVNARLAAEGIEPLGEADRETLVRRLFFDLLGVPPTPADVHVFLADAADDAYERLVDRLLADPRHGERWARHWLDLARYADSDGFRQDAFRPTAWRYRDYVVDAFATDKPFDRFILEQLAGDEFFPDAPAALVATGFLRQTPYEYNQVDVEQQRTAILDEVTDVTAEVFLAMGMACARCHDHKFDPLLRVDYYALQACFAPLVWRDDTPLASPPLTASQRAFVDRAAELARPLREIEAACHDERAWKGLERFPPEIKTLVFASPPARTPHEEQIVLLARRQLAFTPDKLPEAERDRYRDAAKAVTEHTKAHGGDAPPAPPTAPTAADVGPVAPPTRIPDEGDDDVAPAIPEVLGGARLEPDAVAGSTGRRAALARWIASPSNPLTARVIVNRLWQWHFGTGLAATASDFGTLGERPTHPELLDWLAAELVAHGWSVRHVDRLIVTSAAYRRAAHPPAHGHRGASRDAHGRLLWRQVVRRLDAEQVRDAALAVSGELDSRSGGPSVPPAKPRRGLYTTTLRNTRDDLCDVFDGPDGSASCPQRNATTTPLQALFLVNGDWMLARARATALAIDPDGTLPDDAAATAAIERVLGRRAEAARVAEAAAFLAAQRSRLAAEPRPPVAPVAQRMPQRSGQAAVIDAAEPTAVLTTSGSGLPAGDFTIEAHVVATSLSPEKVVRTIASQWTGVRSDAGWSLGLTGEKSAHGAGNLILEIGGGEATAGGQFALVPSGILLATRTPYYVAASVRVAGAGPSAVTFTVRDLSDNDAPTLMKTVPCQFRGSHAAAGSFAIGGRDGRVEQRAAWDGLIDDVRLSSQPLDGRGLLLDGGDAGAAVAGQWTFEESPGFLADVSGHGRTLARAGAAQPVVADVPRHEALVDLCHVLLNTSDFLYVD
ncbi:MAG: DUF1549 domain-containing protein, partial [Planctomycetaceae bacterium]